MPFTTLTLQQIQLSTASAPGYTSIDVANGNLWANVGREFLHIVNTGASAITAVALIQSLTSYAGVVFPAQTAVVPSSITGIVWGPFAIGVFNSGDGNTYLNWSAVTGLSVLMTKVAVLQLPLTAT